MISREGLCADDEVVGLDSGNLVVRTAQTWAHDNLVPLNVSLEITQRCNIRCVHCYNFDRDQPRHAAQAAPATSPGGACGDPSAGGDDQHELSSDEIVALMGDLRAAGCLFLSLTGGEVFSHPELFRFLDRARELNLAVQLLTNGTMLRPGVTGRLAKYPNLMGVSVSVYGATAEAHDRITQVVGSFTRTWAGVDRLRAAGVAVRVKFIVMRDNAHEVDAMMALASGHDLPFSVDLTITARHDGTAGSLATRIGREQLEALCRGPLRPLIPLGPRVAPPPEASTCNCARGNCAISARGEVYPCISVPWSAGNVRRQPFAAIWRDSPVFAQIRGLTLKDFGECAPCAHRAYCSRDRGAAYNATGDYTDVDPFVCATAELTHRLVDEAAGARPSPRPRRSTAGHRTKRRERGKKPPVAPFSPRGESSPHGSRRDEGARRGRVPDVGFRVAAGPGGVGGVPGRGAGGPGGGGSHRQARAGGTQGFCGWPV